MGNTGTQKAQEKKPVIAQSSNDSKIAHGTVLSNVPGVSAPPRFVSKKGDELRPETKIQINNGLQPPQQIQMRHSPIDTLPRHTAGSEQVVAAITNNKERSISAATVQRDSNNTYEDETDDSLEFRKSGTNRKPKAYGMDDLSIDTNNNRNNRNVHSNFLKKPSRHSDEDLSSFLNELQARDMKKTSRNNVDMIKLTDEHGNVDNLYRKPSRDDRRRISDEETESEDSGISYSGAPIDAKKYENLSKEKEKLVKDLLSLNKIENDQKLKILEQERQLRIQNMKLNDVLLVKNSIKTFKPIEISDYDDFSDPRSKKPTKNKNKYRAHAKIPDVIDKVPMRFPTIITKYEPNSCRKRSRHSSIDESPVDLYLETIEDLVDATGKVISSTQSLKYIGKTIETSNLKPQLISTYETPINLNDSKVYSEPNVIYEDELLNLPNDTILSDNYDLLIDNKPKSKYGVHKPIIQDNKNLDNEQIKEVLSFLENIQKPVNKPTTQTKPNGLKNNNVKLITPTPNLPRKKYPNVPSFTIHKKPLHKPNQQDYKYFDENFQMRKKSQNFNSYKIPDVQDRSTTNKKIKITGKNLSNSLKGKTKYNEAQKNVLKAKSGEARKPESENAQNYNLNETKISETKISEHKIFNSREPSKDTNSENLNKTTKVSYASIKLADYRKLKRKDENKPLDFVPLEKPKTDDTNESVISYSNSSHSDYQRNLARKAIENDLKQLEQRFCQLMVPYSNNNNKNSNGFNLKKLAAVKDGGMLVKELDEDLWDPSVLSNSRPKSQFTADGGESNKQTNGRNFYFDTKF